MRRRTRARELALQALYQIEIQVGGRAAPDKEILEDALRFCVERAEDPEVAQFAVQLVEGACKTKTQLDEKITSVVENWELPRMATIDRCILRLSVYELLYRKDIPPKVSINEAIELAKKYSTANSGTFVNGILDRVYTRFTPGPPQPALDPERSEGEGVDTPPKNSECGIRNAESALRTLHSAIGMESLLEGRGEADLHVHTICSDGTLTPEEVVEEAVKQGLRAVAITDHDCVDAVKAAQRLGASRGIYVIPGIELSGYLHPNEIHILGLFINVNDSNLLRKLEEMKRDRVARVSAMVERLDGLRVHIDSQEVLDLAGSSPPGRMHVAEVVYKRGYCTDIQEVFNKYLGDSGPAYVPKKTITVQQAIELILSTGGVPVYTHPGLAMRDDLIPYLVEWGIQGLEVYYPTHTPSQVERYLQIARKHNLAVSGGSDFHGQRKPGIPLGKVRVPLSMVVALRERA
ncbi:MAG TPA: transcription antitermination factor NusB, partial [Candidatus Tripitaka sp. YC43]